MELPVNIDGLLNGKAVEGNRVEFKKGWNPDSVYRSICAFANDFEDTFGGYVVIGVEEINGRAKRPVLGIDIDAVEQIEKEMVGYNNLITPYYQPRLFIEEVDGKTILVIWAAAGERRPYRVPDRVTATNKTYNYYIRYNSSSIVAKGDYLAELLNLANRASFDDRGNFYARVEDVSMLLIRDFLIQTGSKLVNDLETATPRQVLSQMQLLEGPPEMERVKNVALMMFCHNPERFFPGTQIDIVFYPKGKDGDPDNFTEVEPFKGPVYVIIRKALDYLRNMVIRQNVHKLSDRPEALRVYNYPYQAFEEALVNCMYHRQYQDYQPVEISIMPNQIEFISYGGVDRGISLDDLKAGKRVRARRYRNPRLGEYLKELHLTEGRGTGIPTIYEELRKNGSPTPIIEADDERTYFIITIPCHPEFVCDELVADEEGRFVPVIHDDTRNDRQNIAQNVPHKDVDKNIDNVSYTASNNLTDVPQNVPQNDSQKKTFNFSFEILTDRQRTIISMIESDKNVSVESMAQVLKVNEKTIKRDFRKIRSVLRLEWVGPSRTGHWEIGSKNTEVKDEEGK